MPILPTGTVTFLFTDIEGSTRLWERYPETMPAAVARHDLVLQQAVEAHAGYLVKTTGDGVLAAFGVADEAVAAALDAQRALAVGDGSSSMTLKVRMGLHTGPAQERDGDYFGPTLNRAARLMAVGHGGQVLLSMPTYELVRDHLPSVVTLRDLGERRLKDLARPEHIYQVVVPGLPADFPPLKTLDARRNNLPIQRDPLVGREKEVAGVRELLLRPHVGLVTLSGPGGTGKTRLGLQMGADLVDEFDDGVFFVNLAPVTDPDLVASTIAQTLDVREQGSRPVVDVLKDYLREKSLLLILDNFEQVTAAATLVADLLAAAPKLKVIVTSREVLRLRGEREFPVPPLPLPDPRRLPSLAALSQYAAVELFIQRAAAARPDFTVTNDNAPAIAEICYRLDGLPLAIELAAARVKLFAPQALLQRLSRGLNMLTGGARDLPLRQQTLRDAIAWSYDLLSEPEQALFGSLGVFVGGFTVEAVEAVSAPADEQELDIVDGLASLVDKSLVRSVEADAGEQRFTLLETTREFALEQLRARGEETDLRQRHAAYFLTLAEDFSQGYSGPDAQMWIERVTDDLNNLRSAIEWDAAQAETQEMALRITSGLFEFWTSQGLRAEAERWFEDLLYRPGERGPLWGRRCCMLSNLLWFQGNPRAAVVRATEAVEACRAVGDEAGLGASLVVAGAAMSASGDVTEGMAWLEEGVEILRQHRGPAVLATGGLANGLVRYGIVLMLQGDPSAARRHFEEALTLGRRGNQPLYVALPLNYLGDAARMQGDYAQARTYYTESVTKFQQAGTKTEIPSLLHNLGYVELAQGAYPQAAALFSEALRAQRELGDRAGIAEGLEGLASVASAQGEAQRGARLSGAAEALRDGVGAMIWPANRAPYARHLAALHSQLDDQAFTAAWAEGRAMTMEAAVTDALDVVSEARHA